MSYMSTCKTLLLGKLMWSVLVYEISIKIMGKLKKKNQHICYRVTCTFTMLKPYLTVWEHQTRVYNCESCERIHMPKESWVMPFTES